MTNVLAYYDTEYRHKKFYCTDARLKFQNGKCCDKKIEKKNSNLHFDIFFLFSMALKNFFVDLIVVIDAVVAVTVADYVVLVLTDAVVTVVLLLQLQLMVS